MSLSSSSSRSSGKSNATSPLASESISSRHLLHVPLEHEQRLRCNSNSSLNKMDPNSTWSSSKSSTKNSTKSNNPKQSLSGLRLQDSFGRSLSFSNLLVIDKNDKLKLKTTIGDVVNLSQSITQLEKGVYTAPKKMSLQEKKELAAKNHKKLEKLNFNVFTEWNPPTRPPSRVHLNADTISAGSTNSSSSYSSTSGGGLDRVTSDWSLMWSLKNHSTITTNKNGVNKIAADVQNRQATVSCVKGTCFMRNGHSIVTAEPTANRLQVFSVRNGGVLLATISSKSENSETANSVRNYETGRNLNFRPHAICETAHDNDQVAVSDRDQVYYLTVANDKCQIDHEIPMRHRKNITGLACVNRNNLILIDVGIGCFVFFFVCLVEIIV
ncbi:hypothetical protein HELRODRAFT_166582 [Helobdella robusta]|uniref:Uncharacterized protein n=1 Tax=Helobdella robusta TaxID=6412 RepID=T1EY98_HELRO|nr:hypothetical protein HELRODRAFT_166582 [Helobdella robusta]ESO11574.1 hypothetical protein HELRODRAFT_166582 [Helobdella robusta]